MVSDQRPAAVLIGPPGSGKTTIGQALAAALDVAFHDTDAAIEADQGCSISDIFVLDGEPAFRALEQAEVDAGYVLPCQSLPVSDSITIDYDA